MSAGLAAVLALLLTLPLPQLFDQALAASRDGRFAEALPLWDRVLEIAPDDAAAWSNRGNVQLALGDPQAAIADQERSMALDPLSPDPHLNRGTAEEALQRWEAAAADYRWILEHTPAAGGDPAAGGADGAGGSSGSDVSGSDVSGSGGGGRGSGGSEEQRQLRASALYNLGNVQGSLGDWPAARSCFEQAAELRPGFAMARASAALAAFQLGELETAERQLRALVRRHPLFADARAGLTALLWRRGARGEAESQWAAVSGLDPRYRQTQWLLHIRRWPPDPVLALEQFLALASA